MHSFFTDLGPNATTRKRFRLGTVYVTPALAAAVTTEEIVAALSRHVQGDWGEVTEQDRLENELSLQEGYRLMSVYRTAGDQTFWIITEADRSATVVLLPGDY